MKPCVQTYAQLGLNGYRLVVAATGLAISFPGGANSGGAAVYATERRSGHLGGDAVSGGLLEGNSELEPSRAWDSSKPSVVGTLTSEYRVTWRSPENPRVRRLLETAGLFWFLGGPIHPTARRYRHHLKVQARTKDDAASGVQRLIEQGGGDASDLTVVHSNPDRIRWITGVAEEAKRRLQQ